MKCPFGVKVQSLCWEGYFLPSVLLSAADLQLEKLSFEVWFTQLLFSQE
jgi:hypothetical protein